MKQQDNRGRIGIDGTQVSAFVEVAVVTGEREIPRIIIAAMLFWKDVFDVKSIEGFILLPEVAILASLARALANESLGGGVDQAALLPGAKRRAISRRKAST
jgi:hypothetical protein